MPAAFTPFALLRTLVVFLLLLNLVNVQSKSEFHFKGCGGAAKCLGAAKLERLRVRSGMHRHRNQAELAKQLDDDDDLVRLSVQAAVCS